MTATMPTAATLTDDEMWRLVSARDRAADGRFVYAVRTTGVACRASCPSRRPRRENVTFFATLGDARLAGYRPCRRCRPEEDAPGLVDRARALLEREGEAPTLAELARALGVSASHLQRTFTHRTGLSPRAWAERVRAERMRLAMREGATVSRALFDAGFGSASRGNEAAARHLGMSPGAYRRGGAGLDIRYAFGDSSLGRLLVAWTPRGVCAVYPGEDDASLEAALAAEFPRARRERARAPERVAAVIAALDGGAARPPLDPQGTDFQRAVWHELARIPAGATRSYTDVARALGRPDAVRAVAGACAANNLAVLVPCHRVLRGDGGVGGYRWGVPRKQALLARERQVAS
ncbi:MAG TPA: bifunctional DNA-binding transcriptional regulator/O6-methylguanine-DNA methyltransferase Ada [Gemmatimonadales bacterium]|nr:bifunctional DNA-binding transcriptional regulator/O6-methylguanine-DNA methyltransferase Ada [Gemmatimonadales bacterium]